MFSFHRHRLLVVPLACAVLLGAAACGGGSNGGGSGGSGKPLDGVELKVGGKEFTEQKVLCEITIQALENAGAKVTDRCGLNGSNSARQALTSGQIDLYWEYTGTGWVSFLKHDTPIPNATQQYQAVAKEDLATNKVKWLDMAPLNDTYAIMAATETAQQLNVKTLSDYAKLVQTKPNDATLCVATEFVSRNDGLPGVQKAYGFTVPKNKQALIDEGAIYSAVDQKKQCNFGEANQSTDGRISSLGLTLLTDDKHFFPQYNAAVTVRQDVITAHPQIADVLNPIAAAMTTDAATQLNGEVDVQGHQPKKVAEDWLKDKGLLQK